jgi:hypothetical protein
VAYQRAADAQARIGRGWFRIVGDYIDERSDEQGLAVRSILNPDAVYADPAGTAFDGADLRFVLHVEDVPNDEFKARFGREPVTSGDFEDGSTAGVDWAPEGLTRIAEYWHVDYVEDTLVLYSDGREGKFVSEGADENDPAKARTRKLMRRQVKYSLINGVDILEGNDDLTDGRLWPGTRLPWFPVIGEELYVDGKKDFRGVVRDTKDPARMYNYWVTAQTEQIALAPKAPYIVDARSIAPYKGIWDVANSANLAFLPYDSHDSVDPQRTYPAPQRQFGEPAAIQAIAIAIRQADNDLKSTGGFFDASLGQAGPQESGKAILARQQQDSMGSSHFVDNLGKAVRACGKELVELIPRFYDTPRIMRILGLDDKPKTVLVHAGQANAPDAALQQQMAEMKIAKAVDLSVGRYDVTIAAGPTYANQAERDNELLGKLLQAAPALAPIMADIIVDNTHFKGKDKVLARLRKQLGPLDDDGTGGQPVIPPEVQQHVAQLEQQVAEMGQALQEAQTGIAAKRLDAEARAQVAQLQAQTDVQTTAMQIASAERIAQLETQSAQLIAELRAQLDLVKTRASVDADTAARRESQAHDTALEAARAHASSQTASPGTAGARQRPTKE